MEMKMPKLQQVICYPSKRKLWHHIKNRKHQGELGGNEGNVVRNEDAKVATKLFVIPQRASCDVILKIVSIKAIVLLCMQHAAVQETHHIIWPCMRWTRNPMMAREYFLRPLTERLFISRYSTSSTVSFVRLAITLNGIVLSSDGRLQVNTHFWIQWKVHTTKQSNLLE